MYAFPPHLKVPFFRCSERNVQEEKNDTRNNVPARRNMERRVRQFLLLTGRNKKEFFSPPPLTILEERGGLVKSRHGGRAAQVFFHGGASRFVIVIACKMRMYVVELVPVHELYVEMYEKNDHLFQPPKI